METKITKDAQNTVKLQKDISYAWKELYEQKTENLYIDAMNFNERLRDLQRLDKQTRLYNALRDRIVQMFEDYEIISKLLCEKKNKSQDEK